MKILIIGMNYIGDTIFITPIIRAIKKHYGGNCTIDVINGSRGIDILKENPYINNIIVRDENNLEFIKKKIMI